MSNNESKHILHIAKRRFVSLAQMNTIAAQNEQKMSFLGSLPGEIITNIPQQKRPEITKELDKIFSDFALSVAHEIPDERFYPQIQAEIFEPKCEQLKSNLEKALNIPNIYIKYVNSGAFKHCFCINFDCGENSYALQTFQYIIQNSNGESHGGAFEAQNCFTAYKLSSHGRVARPFISHPYQSESIPNGYILEKFITQRHPLKKLRGRFVSRRDSVISDDIKNNGNTICGIAIDIGAFKQNPEHITDRKLYYKWHQFAQILDSLNFYSENAYEIFAYLLTKYKKMGDSFFDTNTWPKITTKISGSQNRETAKHILRTLLKLKTKRETFEKTGEYEQIKELLHQDFSEIFNFFRTNHDMPQYTWPAFYPEIVCNILGTDNVPTLDEIATKLGKFNKKISIQSQNGKNRVHWNNYYTLDQVVNATTEHPFLDWSEVISDFQKSDFIQKFMKKIRER